MGRSPPKVKKITAKQATQVMHSMVPKKRTAYALFLADKYQEHKQALPEPLRSEGRVQRHVVKSVSEAWNKLPEEEKAMWKQNAEKETQAQQVALGRLYDEFSAGGDEASSSSAAAARIGFGVAVGNYSLLQEELWSGTSVSGFRARHQTYRWEGMAAVFKAERDFKREARVLQLLDSQDDEHFRHEVYLQVLQSLVLNTPVSCIIFEQLPPMEKFVKERGPLKGEELRAMATQLAIALVQMHKLGVFHADIKPRNIFWSERDCCCKLGRFALARTVTGSSTDEGLPIPYTGAYRCPELWVAQNKMKVTAQSEAFAFGVTLVETAAADHLFPSPEQLLNYDDTKLNPCLRKLSDDVRFVCVHFLRTDSQKRLMLAEFLKSTVLQEKLATQA